MFPSTKQDTNLASALMGSQVQASNQDAGKAFLKFDFKTGKFFLGQAQEEVTGDTLCVNTFSFKHGWVLWSNRKPHKTLVPFTQPLPAMPPAMGANGEDEATEGREFEARFDDDADTVVVFSINSYGGRQGADALLGLCLARANTGEERFLFPVVKLESTSYQHKSGNHIHNPVFTVQDWMDTAGELESATPKVTQAKKEEAAAPTAKEEAAPAVEEVEEEAPVRRRRRRSV